MAKIAPFRGILYNQIKAGKIDELICPPYDIISPAEQQELYRKSPNNVIRLEYGLTSPADADEDNRYTRAAAVLEGWLRSSVLHQGNEPAFFIYEMEYKTGNTTKRLRGIICPVSYTHLRAHETR